MNSQRPSADTRFNLSPRSAFYVLANRAKFAFVTVLVGLLLSVSAATAGAVTITSNAVTGNWNAGTTWSGGVVPAAGDDVVIVPGANITVTSNTHINSITFNNTAATARTLTVNANVTLDVTGAAGITLQNAGAVATNGSLAGSGTINCVAVTVGGTTTTITANATTTFT